jgi:hypothetical protein
VFFKQQGETQRIPIPDTEHQFGIPFESRDRHHMLVNPLARRRFRREWGHKKAQLQVTTRSRTSGLQGPRVELSFTLP